MKSITTQKILKVKGEKSQWVEDLLATETRIKIFANDREIISLSATPLHIKEFVVGFLLTENVIKGDWCPQEIKISEENREIKVDIYLDGFVDLSEGTLTSGCMSSYSFMNEMPEKYEDNFKTDIKKIFSLFKDFQKKSELYKSTGCVHYAALADLENIVFLAEDIGRHNAVDKSIGYALLNKLSLKDKIFLVSGRISSEIVLKASRWKVPIIVSRSAPTSLAIELAEKTGLTVIGFLRGDRCNIYTYPYRINL